MRMVRISAKRQVTIPAAVLHRAGLAAGDAVMVDVDAAGRVVLTKADAVVDRHAGSVTTGGDLGRAVEALRDEW
jgi:AbrB family looped-hinge helix DNA binding protein